MREIRVKRDYNLDLSKFEKPKVTLSFAGIKKPEDRNGPICKYINALFEQYNLTGWKFAGYDNAKVRAGVCYGKQRKIGLSKYFVLHNTAEEIQSTILHEIAHAIDNEDRGYSNHDDHWKTIARLLGDDGARCYDSEKVVMPEGQHLYVCINCSKEVRYHKRKNKKSACGECCNKHNRGRFHEAFLLEYKGISRVPVKKIEVEEEPERIAAHTTSKPKPVVTNLNAANTQNVSKSDKMKMLFDSGVTSISEIAKQVGAHYSHVHTVITKYKNQ